MIKPEVCSRCLLKREVAKLMHIFLSTSIIKQTTKLVIQWKPIGDYLKIQTRTMVKLLLLWCRKLCTKNVNVKKTQNIQTLLLF